MLFDPQEVRIGLSVPVAFQKPEAAALLGLTPFGYLRSLGLKKYHSSSPNKAFSVTNKCRTIENENHLYTSVDNPREMAKGTSK